MYSFANQSNFCNNPSHNSYAKSMNPPAISHFLAKPNLLTSLISPIPQTDVANDTYILVLVRVWTFQNDHRIIASRQILIRSRECPRGGRPIPVVGTWGATANRQLLSFYIFRETYSVHHLVSVVFASRITFCHITEPKSQVPSSWSSMVRSACIRR
jgi:hypothetical protein